MPAPLITAPADPPAKVSESVLEPPRAEPASAKLMEPAVSQTARLSGAVPDAELEASSEFPIVSISKTRPAVVERVQTGLGSPPPGSPETAAPPLGAKPAGTEPTLIEAPSRQPPGVASGDVVALVARGDLFVGIADIVSARLFYERAAEAGDARAALRLGQTYDPSFLAWAHLGSRGNLALALH